MVKICNKCGKLYVPYSKCNDTCKKCFKESHSGNRTTARKHTWKKIYGLLQIMLFLLPIAIADDCTLVEREGKMVCLSCNEGFTLVNDSCKVIPKEMVRPTILDKFLYNYFPSNPFLGFIIVITIAFLIGYVVINRKKFFRGF